MSFCGDFENFLGGNHNAEIDDFESITSEHHTDDIFTDVVHVTFHRRHHDTACAHGFFRDVAC